MPISMTRLLTLSLVAALLGVNAPVPIPDVFPSIPEVRATHGVASVELHVVSDPVTGLPSFIYDALEGVVPTIRVAPGDTIRLTVHDDLPRFERAGENDVNVHFHGLTVAPRAPGDDVLMTLAHPGQTLVYRVAIPASQEPGLYWYHPHVHGETYRDVTGGMSGAIVVEGLERHIPALQAMRERIVVLRDSTLGPGYDNEDMPMSGMVATPRPSGATARKTSNRNPCRPETGLAPTLNRQAIASIGIQAGERQFFRVVNAAAARYFDLSVDGSALELVALDGIALDAYPGSAPTRTVRHIVIPPAGRAEFVVSGLDRPTVLRSACFDSGTTGDADPAVVLAKLFDPRTGPAQPKQQPVAPLTVGDPLPRNVLSQPLARSAATRTIRFTEDSNGFYINDKAFAMEAPPDIIAHAGTVESWTVENRTDEVHAFHIHQVHFAVTAENGIAITERHWQDTVNVPARRHLPNGRAIPGVVQMVMDFRDPVVRGTFVFHCHILDHEDRGMMAKIRVI